VHRPAVEVHDGDLASLGLDYLEQRRREIRMAGLEYRVAVRRELSRTVANTSAASSRRGSNRRWRPGSRIRSNRPLRVRKARSPSFTVTDNIRTDRFISHTPLTAAVLRAAGYSNED
jgi:hypothetical protein